MNDNRFYVYGLFDPAERFPFYIGKGSEDRMYHHFRESQKGKNPHKDCKIQKIKREERQPYAEKLYDNLSENEAYWLEWMYINAFEDFITNIDTSFGGGAGSGEQHPLYGKSHSEESKQKMSDSHKGKSRTFSDDHRRKLSEAKKGKEHSEETKQKLSEAHSELTKQEAQEVKWLAMNGNRKQSEIGKEYDTRQEAVSRIKNERYWSHIDPKRPENF